MAPVVLIWVYSSRRLARLRPLGRSRVWAGRPWWGLRL